MGMQRWATAAGAALVAVILLTGCTGGDEPAPVPTAKDGRTPVPTDAPSTVEQWAFIAEDQKAEWDQWRSEWAAIECGDINDLASASVDCTVLIFQAATMATIASEQWMGATTPGHSEFISTEPPAEIAGLVATTQDVAAAARAASTEWTDAGCGITADADECPALGDALGDALAGFTDQLAAWEAHIPPPA